MVNTNPLGKNGRTIRWYPKETLKFPIEISFIDYSAVHKAQPYDFLTYATFAPAYLSTVFLKLSGKIEAPKTWNLCISFLIFP